ncbi:conserved hypothetical protein [Trichinella spiralis]|uniref:hypothetical protein n=1 Tax=Trichinella spiralis TaxID=6334 RepID=UPI0001EFE89E|nr:conserved hypothetical protein [Trichinella spiralis]
MSGPNFKSFESWVFRWESTPTMWFILVDDDGFPVLRLREGFQREKKDEGKGLNVKIDGGLSSTVECYYLHKEFRSLVVERGYDVDETYESSVERSTKCKEDPHVDLDSRLSAALKFMRRKYSDPEGGVVAVFVDKSLGSVLRNAVRRSRLMVKLHVPAVE